MPESCSYGSVGVPAGNRRHYPEMEVMVSCSKFGVGRDIGWGDLSEGAEGAVNKARVSGAPGGLLASPTRSRAPPCDDQPSANDSRIPLARCRQMRDRHTGEMRRETVGAKEQMVHAIRFCPQRTQTDADHPAWSVRSAGSRGRVQQHPRSGGGSWIHRDHAPREGLPPSATGSEPPSGSPLHP